MMQTREGGAFIVVAAHRAIAKTKTWVAHATR